MITRIATLIFVLFLSVPAGAREIADVDVAEKIKQADGTELLLNGAGIRKKFFFKIYIAEMYLENKHGEVAALLNDSGGKRLVMHFLYSEVTKEDLVEAWNVGFKDNGTEEQLAELSDQISGFNAMFDTVKSGDVIILDYIPEVGTTVTIRGEQKGVVEGKPFNDLLLSIWFGKEPVDEDLREELLGK